jgi:uncharacterized membrane protein YfcA
MGLMIFLIIVCSLTYSFEIIFGLAGTIIMMPILGFVFESKTLVIYSLLPQMLVTTIALSKSYRKVNIKEWAVMLVSATIGAIAGSWLFTSIPNDIFKRMLAVIITLSGIYMVISPGYKAGKNARRVMDFIAGLSHSLFGISGPIVMTRLMGTFEDKTVIRNGALLFFFSQNIIRVINCLINDLFTPEIWKMYAVSAPFLCIVLFFSDRLHFKISNQKFKKLVSWVILFSGIIYFFR